MKLKELESILYSTISNIQSTIVYDLEKNEDLEIGCSVEYAITLYGECEVKHIQAEHSYMVITI